jgi:hypothetical protein
MAEAIKSILQASKGESSSGTTSTHPSVKGSAGSPRAKNRQRAKLFTHYPPDSAPKLTSHSTIKPRPDKASGDSIFEDYIQASRGSNKAQRPTEASKVSRRDPSSKIRPNKSRHNVVGAGQVYERIMNKVDPQSLENLFARPYWKRVWIIQEVAVASKVRIPCGGDEINWDDLGAADKLYRKSTSQERTNYSYIKNISLFRKRNREKEPLGLLQAMHLSRNALSSDQHDKIFGLLGLSHDGNALVPLLNYDIPINELLQDLTRQMIVVHRSLDYIFSADFTSKPKPDDLPSWTPNVCIRFLIPWSA